MIISYHRNIKKERRLFSSMDDECEKCGVSGEDIQFCDVISAKGIVKMCVHCASAEGLPIVRRPTIKQIELGQKNKSVKDRLTGMSAPRLIKREVTLRDLIDRDFKAKKVENHPDVEENFHWTIQRIRRARKISRDQFAKAIGEPESVVRMIEQGFLPESNIRVLPKIESYLGVSLRKKGSSGFPNTNYIPEPKATTPEIKKPATRSQLPDIREMRKLQEEKPKNVPVDSWEGDLSEEKVSDEEIDFDED